MHWIRWLIITLAVINGGWMAFDGARALVVGDYITPSEGAYAGQLGPWAQVVETVGLAPRSTPVKMTFVFYGVVLVLLAGAFAMREAWATRLLLVVAVMGLWYIPFGTLLNVIVILLLLHSSRQSGKRELGVPPRSR